MPDPGRTDPFADIISLVAGPIASVIRSFDQLRRGADELMKGFENFNATMTNLNETAQRVNRLLNDVEEPVRAMIPQVTRTVKLADEVSKRLAAPLENVIPGLDRLAGTLDSPVLRNLPTDLGQFLEVINDLARRMSPLAQLAEQAGGLFGLRIPGFNAPSTSATASTNAPTPRTEPPLPTTSATTRPAPAKKAVAKKTVAKRRAPAKKAAARKR
jgi:ABC-type transporter Mla subunit MlaD